MDRIDILMDHDIEEKRKVFVKELASFLNKYCKENDSDTPDYMLAEYLVVCLDNYSRTVRNRDRWFGIEDVWSTKRKLC